MRGFFALKGRAFPALLRESFAISDDFRGIPDALRFR
jgi:hypothetical protein